MITSKVADVLAQFKPVALEELKLAFCLFQAILILQVKTTTSMSFSTGNLLVLDNVVFRNASLFWANSSHMCRTGKVLQGDNGKDLSKSISFTWSKTTAKPNTWKQMVQLLFNLFEGQGLFFFLKQKKMT